MEMLLKHALSHPVWCVLTMVEEERKAGYNLDGLDTVTCFWGCEEDDVVTQIEAGL